VTDMKTPPQMGDEIELLGDQMPVRDVAAAWGTNAYEILTGIGPRVPRRYTDAAA
jgi:alanine racemase